MKFIEKLPNWLRWILIPIICPIAWLVIGIIGRLLTKILLFLTTPGAWSENFFEYLINPGVSSYLTIGLAMMLAPTKKKIAGFLMVFVLVAYAGVLVFLSFISQQWSNLLIAGAIIAGSYFGISEESTEY